MNYKNGRANEFEGSAHFRGYLDSFWVANLVTYPHARMLSGKKNLRCKTCKPQLIVRVATE